MNNPLCQNSSLLARALRLIILVVFCNAAATINSFVKADTAPEPNIECLFNWAQAFYPNLFSPSVSDTQFFSPYTYRYYPNT
jgi:triacylglycerol lipase